MIVRFTTTRLSGGYDMQEVDDFLDRVEPVLRGTCAAGPGASITPEEVLQLRFSSTRFGEGYAMDEVDDLLDSVIVPMLRGELAYDPERDYTAASGGVRDSAEADSGGGGTLRAPRRRGGVLQRLFGGR